MKKWRKKWKLTKTETGKLLELDRRSIYNYEQHGCPLTVEYALKWLDCVWSKEKKK